MKRIIALLLALIFVLGLVACAPDGEGEESSAPETEESTPAPEESELKNQDRIKLPYRYEMSDALKYLIENAWESEKEEELVWFDEYADVLDNEATRYYGMFGNNYYIIFEHIGWDIEGGGCTIDIGGESFSHSEMFEIYGYKEGTFTELSMLYESGLLELGELMVIADIHAEFENYIKMYTE
jgi:hypothetical protein